MVSCKYNPCAFYLAGEKSGEYMVHPSFRIGVCENRVISDSRHRELCPAYKLLATIDDLSKLSSTAKGLEELIK